MNRLRESTRDRLRRLQLFAGLGDESLDRLAGLSRIIHLDRKEILAHRAWCGLPSSVDPALAATAERVAAELPLKMLAWHVYRRIFKDSTAAFAPGNRGQMLPTAHCLRPLRPPQDAGETLTAGFRQVDPPAGLPISVTGKCMTMSCEFGGRPAAPRRERSRHRLHR